MGERPENFRAMRGRQVSDAEFRRLYLDKTKTLADIGKELGITERAVASRAAHRGLPARGRSKSAPSAISADLVPLFTAMWLGKVRSEDMGRHFGFKPTTILRNARRMGLPARGRSFPNHAITIEEWREAITAKAMEARAKAERRAWKEVWGRQENASAA